MGVMLMTNETSIAYIAGLVDGEAYIGIKKVKPYKKAGQVNSSYQARIVIHMVNEQAIKFIATTLGGWYHKEKRIPSTSKLTKRTLYKYEATNLRAEKILTTIFPYLLVKQNVAETVLQFCSLKHTSRHHRTKPTGTRLFKHWTGKSVTITNMCLSDEYIAMCDKLYTQCRELNH
jgi:hypothetical protein